MPLPRISTALRTILAVIGLSGAAHAVSALDLPYQHLPVRILPEIEVPNGFGGMSATIDWAAVGITDYTSPEVATTAISRDGWVAIAVMDEAAGSVKNTILRRDPATGVVTNLGKPADAAAATAYAEDRDIGLSISPGGWVSLVYFAHLPECRLYGPSASGWTTPTVGGNQLIFQGFDQSIGTPLGFGWSGNWSLLATAPNSFVLSSYTYNPVSNTSTNLAASLPYNATTHPQGVLVDNMHGTHIAGSAVKEIDPLNLFDTFTGTIGSAAAFNLPAMPTPVAVPGANWATSEEGWYPETINSTGVVFAINDGTDNFSAAAYRAHGSTAAPTNIALPLSYNTVYFDGVDPVDGGFFVRVVQNDSNGNWFSGFPGKWSPTGGFVNLQTSNAYTLATSDLEPTGGTLDGTWFIEGDSWASGGAQIDQSPMAAIPTPLVTMAPVTAIATEGGSDAVMRFSRTGSMLFHLDVKFSLSSTTEILPVGATLVSGLVYKATIPRGSATLDVNFQAVNDTEVEPNELASISLEDGQDQLIADQDRNAGLFAYDHASVTRNLTIISDDIAINPQPVLTRSGSDTTRLPVTITITFNEAVVNVADGDLTTSVGTLGSIVGSTASVYTATWTPPAGATGSVTLSMAAGIANASDDNATSLAATALTIAYDTQAPTVSAPVLALGSDSGTSGDNLTNETTPTLTGTAEANAIVRLYDTPTGGTLLGTGTADGAGLWSITTVTLASGVNQIQAEAQDAIGNVSARSVALSLTLDTTPPALAVTTSPTSPTNQPSTTWSGTVDSGLAVTAEITTGASITTQAATATGAAWTIALALVDGSHSVRFFTDDAAGNRTYTGSTALFVEAVGPTVVLSGATAVMPGVNVSLTAAYSDAGMGVNSISLVTGNLIVVTTGTTATAAVSGTGTATRTIDLTGITGTGTISVTIDAGTAVDNAANNATASNTLVITVDGIAPVAPTVGLDPTSDSAASGDLLTNDSTPLLTGTAAEGATLHVTVTGVTTADLGTSPVTAGTWAYGVTSVLNDGVNILHATLTDAAGNVSTATDLSLTIDTQAPAAPVLALTSATNDSTPAITGTTTADTTVAVTVAGSTQAATVVATSWTFTVAAAQADGTLAISAAATDAAGNISPAVTGSLIIDTVAPVVTPGTPSAVLASSGTTVTFPLTYADANSGLGTVTLVDANVSLTRTGTTSATAATSGTGANRTVTLTGLTGDGTIVVVIAAGTATDVAGNLAGAASSIAITVDNTAPVVAITTASATTANLRPTLNGTVEAGASVQVFDGATLLGSATVSAGTWAFSPSTDLTEGAHSLTASATDLAGNSTTSAPVIVTITTAGPTVVATAVSVGATTAVFSATFASAVTGFDASDVIIAGTAGGTKSAAITNPSGDNRAFTITISGLTVPAGTVTVRIAADAALASGNPSQASNTASIAWAPASVPIPPVAGDSNNDSEDNKCGLGGSLGMMFGLLLLTLSYKRRRD